MNTLTEKEIADIMHRYRNAVPDLDLETFRRNIDRVLAAPVELIAKIIPNVAYPSAVGLVAYILYAPASFFVHNRRQFIEWEHEFLKRYDNTNDFERLL